MIKKIIIFILVWIYLLSSQVFANIWELNNKKVSIKVENVFKNFTKNLENKYSKDIAEKKINILLEQLYSSKNKFASTWDKKIIIDSLIKLSNDYIFEYSYIQEQIQSQILIKKFPSSNYFQNKINSNDSIFREKWVWYTYVFEKHLSFWDWVSPKLSDLEFNKIDTKTDLFFITNNNKPWFVTNAKKIRLISDSIIYGIPNKKEFLKEIRDDRFHIHENNIDLDILKIKSLSQNLTKDAKNKDEKIKILYDYVLKNTKYTQNLDLWDKTIFSWIETFKNNSWVCEWYAKLFQYLLYFSDINDVKTIRGYVIDATDYPNIWHAWVKIWDKYYDPTFDDPIWPSTDREYEQYLYYGLPKDLFYTNRYEYLDSNVVLEKSPLSYRIQYVQKQLVWVFQKYKNSDFNILKELQFRDTYNLDYYKPFTLNDLYNKIDYKEVEKFKIKWTNQYIKNLQYYDITDKNIENILKQINYDFNDYTLLKWINEDWEIIYRIWFNITIN